jgi:HTH-type transcriptional regulator/antitoxin HigA
MIAKQNIKARPVNAQRYGRLLAKTLPAIIETEEENERILAAVEPLLDKGQNRTPEEDRLFKLMVHLIQDFEDQHYDLHATTPLHIVKHLMEARGLRPQGSVRDIWNQGGNL